MSKKKQSCCIEADEQEKTSCGCSTGAEDESCCSDSRSTQTASPGTDDNPSECTCGGPAREITDFRKIHVEHEIITPAGPVPAVPVKLTFADLAGNFMARFGFQRMNYAVKPGIYATGRPGKNSPVLVSANYKMSFDALRKELSGIDAWIMALDTKGVNVWCAAGKGTFGDDEIVNRIKATKLYKVVMHRDLIVPQLGAPGTAAHGVRKRTGFKVNYGPVEARDIKSFISSGMKADEKQRTVMFGVIKRLEAAGIEFMTGLQIFFALSALAILAASFTKAGFSLSTGLVNAAYFIAAMLAAAMSATVIPAALLPVLPGRMFSIKGAVSGLVVSLIFVSCIHPLTLLSKVSIVLLSTAMASFVFMNYTGTTTFTSLTGVRKEIAVSVPVMIIAGIAGFALQIIDFVIKGAIKWN